MSYVSFKSRIWNKMSGSISASDLGSLQTEEGFFFPFFGDLRVFLLSPSASESAIKLIQESPEESFSSVRSHLGRAR